MSSIWFDFLFPLDYIWQANFFQTRFEIIQITLASNGKCFGAPRLRKLWLTRLQVLTKPAVFPYNIARRAQCAYISWFKEEGWKYFWRFVFFCFNSWANLNSMIVLKLKTKIIKQICYKSTKSPHCPLKGKVGQLSRRKRVLCWSIYIIATYRTPADSARPVHDAPLLLLLPHVHPLPTQAQQDSPGINFNSLRNNLSFIYILY